MFNDTTGLVVVTGVSLVLLAIFRQLHGRRLPPGPPGLPLLGNLLQIPAQRVTDEYGSLVSLNVAGNTLILVGDMKTGKQLLEKQAAKHSARPVYHYFRTHVDPSHEYWALHPESESSDLARKLTMGVMSLVRAGKTEPLQEFEALINIQLLLDDGGKDWFEHMNRQHHERLTVLGLDTWAYALENSRTRATFDSHNMPPVRSGIPHRATADDIVEHKGQEYFIPRGSIIFPVAWAIEHDKTRFEDNDRFYPRHFLDEEGKLKPNYETSAFGFGRRRQFFPYFFLQVQVLTTGCEKYVLAFRSQNDHYG
ncbi:hypothetical protein H0H93_008233 [Arthromyces matolae]|nr:hypothetical protein H0H93_008233 [Arthromyces matolae]